MLLFLLFAGAYEILFSLIMNTKNFQSALVFKFLPFISGLGTLLYALQQLHIFGGLL